MHETYRMLSREHEADNDMGTFGACLNASRGEWLVLMGRWDEAVSLCNSALQRPVSPINRLHLLIPVACVQVRRGEPQVGGLLDQMLQMAEVTEEIGWIALVSLLRAEANWLAGRPGAGAEELLRVYERVLALGHQCLIGAFGVWLQRCEALVDHPGDLPAPYARELSGDPVGAEGAWLALGCSYEAAMAGAQS